MRHYGIILSFVCDVIAALTMVVLCLFITALKNVSGRDAGAPNGKEMHEVSSSAAASKCADRVCGIGWLLKQLSVRTGPLLFTTFQAVPPQ